MKKLFNSSLIAAVLYLFLTFNLASQPATPLIRVIVSPDHKDWNYKTGEEVKFTVQIR
jgi:uncharacterized protein (DUF58 family)